MSALGSNVTHRRHTRYWLLALVAVVVVVPAAVAAYLIDRDPTEPTVVPFAMGADGAVVDLGTLATQPGVATDISDAGTVVGYYFPEAGGVAHAFVSRSQNTTDLGASRAAVAVNDAGQVVVTDFEPTLSGWHPAIWQDGSAQELTSDLGPLYRASDIDRDGRVAGEILSAPTVYTWPMEDNYNPKVTIGVIWEDGRATVLETADAIITRPVCIDDSGAVLGQGRVKGSLADRTLVWREGTITDLGECGAVAMNDLGQIVLRKMEGVDEWVDVAYIWSQGHSIPVKDARGTAMLAYDINDSGLVAGQVDDKAAFWQNGRLTMLDLHSKNSWVQAVNDAGVIVGARQK